MKTWRCPKCNHVQKCLASEVAHRCPKNRRLMTQYVVVADCRVESKGSPAGRKRT